MGRLCKSKEPQSPSTLKVVESRQRLAKFVVVSRTEQTKSVENDDVMEGG